MMINKFIYCLRAALHNIRRGIILNALASSTIAVTFIIFVTFLLVLFNLTSIKKNWLDRMQVIVYFSETVSEESARKAAAAIEALDGVAAARFVPREEALVLLRSALAGQDGILEGLSGNPLPHSAEISLTDPAIDASSLESLAQRLRRFENVADVEYGQKWFDRFAVLFNTVRVIGSSLGGLLFLFTLFIVSNTIRLMVFMRRDEIEIMRLVGATTRFIKLPFCLEGVIQGLSGAAAALVFFLIAGSLFLDRARAFLQSYLGLETIIYVDATTSCYVLLLGAAIGLAGSLVSLGSLDELQR